MRSALLSSLLVICITGTAAAQESTATAASAAPQSPPKASMASRQKAVAALKYVEIKDFSHPLVNMCSVMAEDYVQKPAEVTAPDAAGNFRYFHVTLGGRQLNFAFDSSRGGVIYADTNFDSSLKGEKAYPGAPYRGSAAAVDIDMAMTAFGPIELQADGGVAKVRMIAFSANMVEVYPAGFMAGQITLDGRARNVGLVDGNFNGKYDDAFDPSKKGDILVFDANDNARIDQESPSYKEMQPLPSTFFVGKSCYSVAAAADGASLTMTPAKPKMGSLEVSCPGFQMAVWSDSGFHFLGGSHSKWNLPAGRYDASLITIVRKDKAGVQWTIQADPSVPGVGIFTIYEGRKTTLKMGTPITVKADAMVSQRQGSVGIVMVGQGGEQYSPAVMQGAMSAPAPKAKILDEEGKTLAAGIFEFG